MICVNPLASWAAISARTFPVQRNPCLLQPFHEPAVGEAVASNRGVDPRDPELSEIPFPRPPVPIGVDERLIDRFGRASVKLAFGSIIPFGQLETGVAPLSGFGTSFCSWHGKT